MDTVMPNATFNITPYIYFRSVTSEPLIIINYFALPYERLDKDASLSLELRENDNFEATTKKSSISYQVIDRALDTLRDATHDKYLSYSNYCNNIIQTSYILCICLASR